MRRSYNLHSFIAIPESKYFNYLPTTKNDPLFYLLFAIYLALGSLLLLKIPFIRNCGLEPRFITGLFLLKVMAGALLGWVSLRHMHNNDYWILHREGLLEYDLLLNHPKEFALNLFHSPYENAYGGFFNSVGSFWNDLRNNIIIKILALFNLLSGGNYYLNSLLFNVFGFIGHVALYRVFSTIFPGRKWLMILGCFLLPSTLYFTSGIHKDQVVFTLLGLFCYCLYSLSTGSFSRKKLIVLVLSASGLLLMRNFIFMALIPATIALLICQKRKWNEFAVFAMVYATSILLIACLAALAPALNPLKIISQKQQDFLDLPAAASQLPMNTLTPDMSSLIKNIPQALNHGFLRPYIWEKAGKFSMLLAVEILFYLFLLIVFLLMREKKEGLSKPFLLFVLFFSISMVIITGLIVPNSSSIVRYKSIFLPLLICPIAGSIRLKKGQ
jgi:hypothetical protein